MKAANKLPGYPESLKTKRQWAELGYVPLDENLGNEYWANCMCGLVSTYFRREDVREGTKEELYEYFKPIREARNEKRRVRNAALKKERMRIEAKEKIIKKYQEAAALTGVECKNPSKTIVFDLETTGLDPDEDEILQISIIDGDGCVLLNTYVHPYMKERWDGAMAVNGITPEMVSDAPYPENLIPVVKGIFQSADLQIAYNNAFDLAFLKKWGIHTDYEKQYDVMLEFAKVYGEWSEYFSDYKWQKLSVAADYYGYKFAAHDSLEDVKATLYVFQNLMNIHE